MPLKRLVKILTSLRLTALLLALSIVLVFVGTVAQADEGLYNAQTRYFKQWIVAGITMFGHRLPILLPGGYLLGTLLLVNLVAAHIARFQFTWKKLGIHVAHAGVILLLVGQLTTDILSRETQVRFAEGETKSYAESSMNYELVFTAAADEHSNEEIVVPGRLIAGVGEVKSAELPFAIRVKQFWKNSRPAFRAPMAANTPPLTTNGVAVDFDFAPRAEVKSMDDKNVPSALVEFIGPGGSLGEWIISGWTGDEGMIGNIQNSYAGSVDVMMARRIVSRLVAPQSITVNGKAFTFGLRPERVYLPFSLTLLSASNSVYAGTDIPKDFRSRVRIQNPRTHEDREVEVYMNNPLRYSGLTFYQQFMGANMAAEGTVPWSALEVVRNPSWFTPYVGCILVALGLVLQFTSHLSKFLSKRADQAPASAGAPPAKSRSSQPGGSAPVGRH
jgi:hypothetical protein